MVPRQHTIDPVSTGTEYYVRVLAFNGVAYAAGTVAAFVSGWAACQWMIRLVKRTNLNVFAVYCLVAGIAAILFI